MKHPDLFKLVLTGNEKMEMVQQGSVINQKIPGTNTVITQTANDNNDLFKKYFGYAAEGTINDRYVDSIEAANDGSGPSTRFRVRLPPQDGATIDFIDYYFNSQALLTRTSIYAEGKELVRTTMAYVQRDDVYVADEIRTQTESEGSKIISIIKYSVLNANISISDREFVLR
jgi:hypothetical protein